MPLLWARSVTMGQPRRRRRWMIELRRQMPESLAVTALTDSPRNRARRIKSIWCAFIAKGVHHPADGGYCLQCQGDGFDDGAGGFGWEAVDC